MLTVIKNAYAGLKDAAALVTTFNQIKTEAEVAAKIIELNQIIAAVQNDLFQAQASYSAVVGRVDELEKELMAVKDWAAQKQRYQLHRFGSGAFTYRLKPEMAGGEPVHDICPTCYEQGIKSVLQFAGYDKKFHKISCAVCGTAVFGGKRQESEAACIPPPSWD